LNEVLHLAKKHQKLSGAVDRERRSIYNCIVNRYRSFFLSFFLINFDRQEKKFVNEFNRFRVVWLGQVMGH
jgi:hypothetical protein